MKLTGYQRASLFEPPITMLLAADVSLRNLTVAELRSCCQFLSQLGWSDHDIARRTELGVNDVRQVLAEVSALHA